ncbi:MAG: hypothetical protein WC449_02865 [Candidatus Paceibacterota bacterium]
MKNTFVFVLALALMAALCCCACGQKVEAPSISITSFSPTGPQSGTFFGEISKLAEKNLQITIQIRHPQYPSGTTMEICIVDQAIQTSGLNGEKFPGQHSFNLEADGKATFAIEVSGLPKSGWVATANATFFYPEDAMESGVFIPQQ